MPIAPVAAVAATPGANGGTTGAVDTSGATLVVISVSWYGGGSAPVVTDSKGNTYTLLTDHASGGNLASHRLFYCLAPVVGTGHTFTAIGTGSAPAIFAYAFSGVSTYQVESGATQQGSISLASGAVTPSMDGALIITGSSGFIAVTDSVSPAGFTLTQRVFVSGTNMQGSAAWLVQATAAVINPTWAYSPSQSHATVGTAVFLPSAAPPVVDISYGAVILPAPDRPFNLWQPLTPSDQIDRPFASLWCGQAGTVAAVMQSGQVGAFTVPAGALVPILGRRVNSTGTTVSSILALGTV